jgi:hypothetical protein
MEWVHPSFAFSFVSGADEARATYKTEMYFMGERYYKVEKLASG